MQDFVLIGHTHFFKTDFSTFYPSFYTHAIAWLTMGKAAAKKSYSTEYLGNLLDKIIELEQNGETHGVPTGNLVTNIIIEYAMTFFDEELEELFAGTTIAFYRYVDDIYFAYDNPRDLVQIKQSLQKITVKYDLELNNKKTRDISYGEINRNSKLLNYLSNIHVTNKTRQSKFRSIFEDYFTIANEEILNGIKGSKKIIYTSLQFFLSRLNKGNQYKALKALITPNTNNELPILWKLVQLVLLDANSAENFVHLIEEIQKIENENWPNKESKKVVTNYFHKSICENPLNQRLFNILYNSLKLNKSEEAYFIFILFQKFNCNLSNEQLVQILNLSGKDSKADYLGQIDDFNWLMILQNVFRNMEEDKLHKNIDIYQKIIKLIYYMLFQKDLDNNIYLDNAEKQGNQKDKYEKEKQNVINNYFQTDHWLLKYELIYNYQRGNLLFRRYVDNFLANKGSAVNIFNAQTFNNPSATAISRFFVKLLSLDYSFSG